VGGDAVTLSRDANTARPATVGLTWPGGHAILTDQVILDGNRVVRTVDEIERGTLRPGVHAFIDMHVFDTDPRIGLDMSFSSVAIPDELGPMPAWYVPPTTDVARDTWVIAVHGRGSDRTEALRVLPTVAATGCPSLIISYRNDVGAPASPDGRYHLGDTEWLDVQAAIEYARDHGAARVVLYGWSMGGAVAMTALRRLPTAQASLVTAVVLDSPVLDWTSTLALQGRQRNLPAPLTWTAERMVERRDQLTLSDFDQRRYAPQLSVPTLLFVDRSDTTVPPAASLQFGHLRPDLVTLITTSGGDHTGSWNVDPVRYDDAVRDFLSAHV
jgi:pimeloyl-ACP methyl ester carboxylesterase